MTPSPSRGRLNGIHLTAACVICGIVLIASMITWQIVRLQRNALLQKENLQQAAAVVVKLENDRWTTLTDSHGGFSIDVRGKVILNEVPHDDGHTDRVLSSYHYTESEREDDAVVFAAIYGTPPHGWKPISEEERFANLDTTLASQSNRTVVSRTSITFGRFPGVEHRIREPSGRESITRTFVIGADTLAVSVSCSNEADMVANASQFFDSLQWLKLQ